MSVLPTPAVKAQSFLAGLYRGLGLAQLAILRDEMAKGKLKVSQRRLKLASGLEILCKVTYNLEEVFISIPEPAAVEEVRKIREIFAFHPRSGGLALLPFLVGENVYHLVGVDGGGYVGTKELPDAYGYPLVDDDHATFAVQEETTTEPPVWTIHWTNAENYGNLFWVGGEEQILSWRGIPNRHFALSSTTYLPGLSRVEEETDWGWYYSCFGSRIYYQGGVLCELPHTLAGAWLYRGFLMCVAVINKRSTTGGFFFQLMASRDSGATWENIGAEARMTHRCTYPAFPDAAGRTFVFENAFFTLGIDGSDPGRQCVQIESVATFEPVVTGTRVVTGTGGWNSTYQYDNARRHVWGEAVDGEFVYSTIIHNATFATVEHGSKGEKEYDVPVYRVNAATKLYLSYFSDISGPCEIKECAHHQPVYVVAMANGAFCSITWSGVACHNGVTASFCDNLCRERRTVSATIYPQNITAYLDYDPTTVPYLSGPNTVNVNDQFFFNRGEGTIQWSITSNCNQNVAINEQGVITSGTQFGTVIVTATDECGRTESMRIVLPEGQWVPTNRKAGCTCFSSYCNDYGMPYMVDDYAPDGSFRYRYNVQAQCFQTRPDCATNLCNSGSISFQSTVWSVTGGVVTTLPTVIDKGEGYENDAKGCCGSGRTGRYVCYTGCLEREYEWGCS